MYEIWWRDRLLDVVPRVASMPEGLTVQVRSVAREPIPHAERDWRFPKIFVMVLLLFGAAVSTLELVPADDEGPPLASFARVMLHVPAPPPPPVKQAIARLKEKATRELFASAPARGNTKAKGSSFSDFWGSVGPIGAGPGRIDALLGKLGGGGGGEGPPGFGGGPRGSGPGFGTGFSIGAPGARRLEPGGVGSGLGPKRDEGPDTQHTTVSDGLPRDVVAKTIRAHANEIKFCFERELQSHQTLSGKVSITFTIGPSGDVTDASILESTLDSQTVETCMISRIRRWRFPEPAGGGVVTVNHPWIFRGAGDNTPENP
jgi:TonB family protein